MAEAVRVLLLVVVGTGAGLVGAVAGVASLVVYPGLLAFGLSPVSANVTSTVANVFGGIGSSTASGPELVGQRRRVRRMAAVAAVGSAIGATLLLSTPSDFFAKAAPAFIALASMAIFLRPRPANHPRRARRQEGVDPPLLVGGTFLLGAYAGYFGAAAGTVLLALLLYVTDESVPRATGVKNVTFLFANAVAAIAFSVFGPVDWTMAPPLAAGFLLGGRLGPPVLRRVPARLLRPLIAAGGVALAIRLGLSAWG